MDFSFTEEQRMMRESVRKLMDRVATPDYVRRLDREQAYPEELYAAWVDLGLLRIPFEERYGGLGGSVVTRGYPASRSISRYVVSGVRSCERE